MTEYEHMTWGELARLTLARMVGAAVVIYAVAKITVWSISMSVP